METYGTSFTMLWDSGFDSWSHYGVRGQPAAILLDADGGAIQGWGGQIPEDIVLELAAENA